MFLDPAPLLAAPDVDTIIGAIVIAFWFLGWIIKLVSGQKQNTPPVGNRPRPPARARDEKLQEEIDIFIKDVGAKKPRRPQEAPRQPATAKGAKGKGAPAAAPQPSKRARPGQEIASRQSPATAELGRGVKQHLQQYMAEKISQEVAAHLKHQVDQSVAQHLGTETNTASAAAPVIAAAAVPASASSAAPVVQRPALVEFFRNPVNVRQAMVANLILTRPAAGRRGARP